MENEQSVAIMKALADQSRLAIVNSLLERSQYVEEIARRHNLAPSTVSFHLRKLEQAGLVRSRKEQYYVVFSANEEIFDTTLRQIVSAHPLGKELQESRMEEYRRKVLESFFRDGRLEKLPAQHKKRLIVLDLFAGRFEAGRRYSEEDVTGLITPLFGDYCTIRRLLVDEGLVRRDAAGYWREAATGDAHGVSVLVQGATMRSTPTGGGRPRGADEGHGRKELKRQYKENRPSMGIYQLRNSANGKIYVGSSENLEATRTSRMFQLRMGTAVFSRELQKDLDGFGAGAFEFSILAVLEPGSASAEGALAALHLGWLEKLHPFGEQGYNSLKSFERERSRLRRQSGS